MVPCRLSATAMRQSLARVALLAALCALWARPLAAYTAGAPSAAFAGAAAVAAEEAIEHEMRPEAGTDEGPHDAVWPALAPRAWRAAHAAPGPGPSPLLEFDAQALQATLMRVNTPFFGPDIGVIPNRSENDYLTSIASLDMLLSALGGPAASVAGAEQAGNATANVTVTDVASEHPPLQARRPGRGARSPGAAARRAAGRGAPDPNPLRARRTRR